MNATLILKLAFCFEQQMKMASLKTNMAKRILFSLLSHLVPVGESARVALTKGVVDYNALKQMIPSAKELIHYGILSALDEAQHYGPRVRTLPDYYTGEVKPSETIQKTYDSGNTIETLKQLTELFNKPNWQDMYGGKNWAKITETMLNIQKYLDAAEEAKQAKDLDSQVDNLMQMTSYVNILDGLAHNSGSIMSKMLYHENRTTDKEGESNYINTDGEIIGELNPVDIENKNKFLSEMDQINRLMDAKELKDPDDVLQEITPILERESDAPSTMKDWMSVARRKKHEYKSTLEEREAKLKQIRIKKEMIRNFNSCKLLQLRALIRSFGKASDSDILDKIIKNKSLFSHLETFCIEMKRVAKSPLYDIIKGKEQYVIAFSNVAQLSRLESHKIRKALWKVEELISEIESYIHLFGE